MSMSTGSTSEYSSEINVTPMVDIMLVLLIIFMVVTPLLSSGINVTLPNTSYSDEDEDITKETSIVVSVPEKGQVFVGKEPAQKSQLTDIIRQKIKLIKDEKRQVVYIKGGTQVEYGEIVDVVQAVQKANVKKIGLVTEKKKDKKAA